MSLEFEPEVIVRGDVYQISTPPIQREEILTSRKVYLDGQQVVCSSCGAIHCISCDSEGGRLIGPDD